MKHVLLDLEIDLATKKLAGTATHSLVTRSAGLDQIRLHSCQLDIKGVTMGGEIVEYEAEDDSLDISITAVPQGTELELAVTYEVHDPPKGIFFIGPTEAEPDRPSHAWTHGEPEDNRWWFPSYDAPNSPVTCEARIRVAEPLEALSNGRLLETITHDDGTRTFHWKLERPHANYLVNLIVGEFDVHEEVVDGITIRSMAPKGRGQYLSRSFSKTGAMMRFFNDLTGVDYPWPRYDQVVVDEFIWGGMENTTLTVLYAGTLHDENAHLEFRSEPLVAHELAHQWFGDLLMPRSWAHLWLNEGFASYLEALWVEETDGVAAMQAYMFAEQEGYLNGVKGIHARAIVQSRYREVEELFDVHRYNKAASVLHLIRGVIGDEVFRAGVKHYVRTRKETVVETRDLREAFEEATGVNIDLILNQWVHRPGHLALDLSWKYEKDAGLVALSVKQKHTGWGKLVERERKKIDQTPFQLPLHVVVSGGSGEKLWEKPYEVEISQRQHTFHLPLKRKPRAVVVDPDNWILAEQKFKRGAKELVHVLAHLKQPVPAIRAARELGDHPHVAEVLEVLSNSVLDGSRHWSVRAAAAKALGNLRTETAWHNLRKVLGELDAHGPRFEARVRRACVQALGSFRRWSDDVAPFLADLAATEPSHYTRASAVRAIAGTRHSGAAEMIRPFVGQDSHVDFVNRLALGGLADLRDFESLDLMMKQTGAASSYYRRTGAISNLALLSTSLPEEDPRRRQVYEHLTLLLEDREFGIRRTAIQALGILAEPGARAALGRLRDREVFGMLRREAQKASRRINEKSGSRTARGAFKEEIDQLRGEQKELKVAMKELESKLEALLSRQPEKDESTAEKDQPSEGGDPSTDSPDQ